MGICQQKPPKPILTKSTLKIRQTRDSFLLNSFTFDPSYFNKVGFFYFDLSDYCEIQYLLRNSQVGNQGDKFRENIKKHIENVEKGIKEFSILKGGGYIMYSSSSGSARKIEIQEKQKQQSEHTNSSREIYNEKKYQNENNKFQETENKTQQTQYLDHILNFQLSSATLPDFNTEDIQSLSFQLRVNKHPFSSIQGSLSSSIWRPNANSQFQVRFHPLKINFSSSKCTQISIKTKINNMQIQCTLLCNSNTFKYIIPVLQTSNLRYVKDNEPAGQVNFRVEYIDNFEQHRKKVIQDLEARKQGLLEILQIGSDFDQNMKKGKNTNFKSIIVAEESYQSFLSMRNSADMGTNYMSVDGNQ